jgi:hypothetical protein
MNPVSTIPQPTAPGARWKLTSTSETLHEGDLGACIKALPYGAIPIGEQFESNQMLSEYHFKFSANVPGGVDYATLKIVS